MPPTLNQHVCHPRSPLNADLDPEVLYDTLRALTTIWSMRTIWIRNGIPHAYALATSGRIFHKLRQIHVYIGKWELSSVRSTCAVGSQSDILMIRNWPAHRIVSLHRNCTMRPKSNQNDRQTPVQISNKYVVFSAEDHVC